MARKRPTNHNGQTRETEILLRSIHVDPSELRRGSRDRRRGARPARSNGEESVARGLSARQRSTLAWIIEDWPYPYRGSPMDDVQGLVKLGLVHPPTEDEWGAATALGRRVWKHAKPTWIREWDLGAAYGNDRRYSHDPIITLDDGSILTFHAEELPHGDGYGIDILRSYPTKR